MKTPLFTIKKAVTSVAFLFIIGLSQAQWSTTGSVTSTLPAISQVQIGLTSSPANEHRLSILQTGGGNYFRLQRTLDTGYWTIGNSSSQNGLVFWFTNSGGGQVNPFSLFNNGNASFGGSITIDGHDLVLGTNDYRSKGTNTLQRALVHDANDILIVNYGGDFEGGTFIDSKLGVNTRCIPTDGMLAVNGKIYATALQIKLTNGSGCFPDYVFDPSYKLMSLRDVEAFIQKNKHLPEVPSAIEAEKNGIDVEQMEVLLLKKVEELTLYMIQLKKQNEHLQEQNAVLTKDSESTSQKLEILSKQLQELVGNASK